HQARRRARHLGGVALPLADPHLLVCIAVGGDRDRLHLHGRARGDRLSDAHRAHHLAHLPHRTRLAAPGRSQTDVRLTPCTPRSPGRCSVARYWLAARHRRTFTHWSSRTVRCATPTCRTIRATVCICATTARAPRRAAYASPSTGAYPAAVSRCARRWGTGRTTPTCSSPPKP